MKISRENAIFYIGAVIALIPMIALRDFTPANELRYLSIADEALLNHNFFAFTNHGVPYADKPPLYLWIIMLCRWLTGGHHMWLLSLFSLLPALGVVCVMDRWAEAEWGLMPASGDGLPQGNGTGYRNIARLMLLTSGFFIGSAITLRMDMLMCLFIVLSLREFWKMFKGADGCARAQWLFPVYVFLALFTKGPYGLLIPLVGTAAFLAVSGRIRQFFRYWGWRTWTVLVVLCALWFIGVYADGGREYLDNLLFHQTVGRAVNSFHHKAPFYYYLVSIWYSIAPWSLLAVGAIVAALRPKWVRTDLQRFFLTVSVSTFVLLSCFSAKLQVYMLPAFPFMIYAAALCLPRLRGNNVWVRVALTVPAAIFTLAVPGLVAAVRLAGVEYLGQTLIYIGAALLTLTGIGALYELWHRRRADTAGSGLRSAVLVTGAGMLAAVYFIGFSLPKVNAYLGYGELCSQAVELSRECGTTDFRTWRIRRSDNMDVYLHAPVQAYEQKETPQVEGPCILMIRTEDLGLFPQAVGTRVVRPYAVTAVP